MSRQYIHLAFGLFCTVFAYEFFRNHVVDVVYGFQDTFSQVARSPVSKF